MKSRFSFIILSVLVMVLAGCSFHGGHQKMLNQGMGTLMAKKLDLSAQQVKDIDALTEGKMAAFQKHTSQMMLDLTGLDVNATDYEARYQQLAKDAALRMEADITDFAQTRAKVLALLDEPQRQKLEKMRERWLAYHAKQQDTD